MFVLQTTTTLVVFVSSNIIEFVDNSFAHMKQNKNEEEFEMP